MKDFKIDIYADGASIDQIIELSKLPYINGFTTNPTLMKKAGVKDYKKFALDVLNKISDRPISFEVFADEFDEMYEQAKLISCWGPNVFVKIPVMNTKGAPAIQLISRLAREGVSQNVTAIFTPEQIEDVIFALKDGPQAIISIFAGRIADTGVDPMPIMEAAVKKAKPFSNLKILWASPREILNVVQAEQVGCHIITATFDILKKLKSLDKNLHTFSRETVEMFYNDACLAGFSLKEDVLNKRRSEKRAEAFTEQF